MNEHLQSIDTITSKVHIISLSDISKRDFLRWAAGLSITPNQDFQDEAADEASHLQETSIFQPHRSSFQGSCSHSCSQSGKTSTLLETCTSTLIYSYGTDEIQSGNHAYDTGHSSPLTGSEVFYSGYDGSESGDSSFDSADALGSGSLAQLQAQHPLEVACAHNINTLIGPIVNPDPEIEGTISNSNPDANPGQFYFEYSPGQFSPEFFDRYEIRFMTIHLFVGPSHNAESAA
jgi:hypothetical protein